MQPPFSSGGRMLRLLIGAAIAVGLAAVPAHAQMTKGVKALLQTAATTCVEWVSGRVDFSQTPPPGFRSATVFERFGFNIGAGDFGGEVTAVWVGKPGAAVGRWVLGLEEGCMVYAATDLAPVAVDLMKSTFETLMRRIDPDAPDLEFDHTYEDGELRFAYYVLDENPDLMVTLGQGWREGEAIRGPVFVLVTRL